MNRKFVIAVALTLILSCSLVLMFNIPVAEAGETIYIRVDGSIDPPSANITSADNVTYTLIGNVNDSVVVQRANIVLDGVGYTVQGTGSGTGINVTGVSNVTIMNCIIKSFRVGIYLDVGANNGVVENNTIQNLQGALGEDAVGVYLKSNYSIIFNNTISSLTGGTGGAGGYMGYGGSGGVSSGVYLSGSSNVSVTSNTITNMTGGTGGIGGYMGYGGSGGIASGVYLSSSTGNNLTSNLIANLTGGSGGTAGRLGGSGSKGTSQSLYLYQSSSLTIRENRLQTADCCLYLNSSSNNIIYYNNFNATAYQVYNYASNNTWDNGYPLGGNYWSNYTGVDNYSGPYQNETGSDGIGDTPVQIDQYNKDNYPIMNQGPYTHDVAITNMTLSTYDAYSGQVIEINVTAKNLGSRYESFNVTAYYDNTVIGNHEVHLLAPGTQENLSFSWDTTDATGGCNYTISAKASLVPEETNTTNNILIGGTVKVTSPVSIVEVVPCNQTGYPKDSFQRGTLAYFKVTVNSTALLPQTTLITINLFDNATITIGVVSFQGPILPGTSTIMFGLPIPATTTIGTATIYADCYTDWPSQGGFPHCPEMSATLEITGP